MKKFLIAVVLLATFTAGAVERKAFSFINEPSICISNSISFTNLNAVTGNTNYTGNIFTNKAGSRVIVGTTTNAAGAFVGQYENVFADVVLSPLTVPYFGNITNSGSEPGFQGPAAIVITLTGQSGANSACNFRFTPVFDGVEPGTAASEQFTVGVTANTTTKVTVKTNLPLWMKMNNAIAIRCDWALNTDTDASSRVDVTKLELIQLVP